MRKIKVVMVRVPWSKRSSKNCGTVATPLLRKRGRKNNPIKTSAQTAMTSQAITLKPSVNAAPLRPTICSVDRLVSSSDPAINGPVSRRPARKYPSELAWSSPRVIA